jgi:hypothetical protein
MPVSSLANSTYEESVTAWRTQTARSHSADVEYLPSLDRFRIAADRVQAFKPDGSRSAIDYAREILSEVGGNITQWSIVYVPQQLRVDFRTKTNPQTRFIDLKKLDFSCTTPLMMLDVHEELSGDITQAFHAYSSDAHLKHAAHAWSRWGGDVSRGTLEEWIRNLESFPCTEVQAGENDEE